MNRFVIILVLLAIVLFAAACGGGSNAINGLQINQGLTPISLTNDLRAVSMDLDTEWDHTWGLGVDDVSNGIAADPSGNYVYSVGYTGTQTTETDAIILKYAVNGDLVWSKKWGETGVNLKYEVASDVAVSADGYVYVTGWKSPQYGQAGGTLFLLKLDGSGVVQWAKTWKPTSSYSLSHTVGYGVATYGSYIYVTGYSQGATAYGNDDAILLQFSDNGSLNWVRDFGYGGFDEGDTVAVDENGDIYVGARVNPLGGTAFGGWDLALLRFSPDGTRLATASWGIGSSYAEFSRVSVCDGDVYAVGYTGPDSVSGNTFILKYNKSLALQWERLWAGSVFERGMGAAVIGQDLYVAGLASSSSTKGLFLLDIAKADGTLLTQRMWDVPSYSESASDIIALGGKLYIGGAAGKIGGSWSFANGTYSIPNGVKNLSPSDTNRVTTLGTLSLSTSDVSGTIDTGGGRDDALLIKLGPSYAPTGIEYTGVLNWTIPYGDTGVDVLLEAKVTWTGDGDGSGFLVTWPFWGEDYWAYTTAGGFASYQGPRLPAGEYPITCYLNENSDIYDTATLTVTREVYAPESIDYTGDLSWTVPYGDSTTDVVLEATVTWTPESADGSGLPVVFALGGNTYSATTVAGGIAQYTLPLGTGEHPVTCYTPDLDGYSDNATLIVEEDYVPTGIEYTGVLFWFAPIGGTVDVVLQGTVSYTSPPDGAGIPVVFDVNGVTYDATTVVGGVAQYTVPLAPGDYPITCYTPDKDGFSDSAIIRVFSYDPNADTFITGGGWIPGVDPENPNGRANFGFNAKYLKDGTIKGTFTYLDGAIKYNGVAVTKLYFSADGKSALFGGDSYWAYITDNGEPGTNDYIRVWTIDNSYRNGNTLSSGNIQVHNK